MIARLWRGWAMPDKAADYERHFIATVAPRLQQIAGHGGAWLLKRESEGRVEFLTVTLWRSMTAIRGFAGDQVERAVVEPAAVAALADFDADVVHYEIAHPCITGIAVP